MTGLVFDWRDRAHVGRRLRPCRHCRGFTLLRDESGSPAHKTCAERVRG